MPSPGIEHDTDSSLGQFYVNGTERNEGTAVLNLNGALLQGFEHLKVVNKFESR
jgi:hypothetical protein